MIPSMISTSGIGNKHYSRLVPQRASASTRCTEVIANAILCKRGGWIEGSLFGDGLVVATSGKHLAYSTTLPPALGQQGWKITNEARDRSGEPYYSQGLGASPWRTLHPLLQFRRKEKGPGYFDLPEPDATSLPIIQKEYEAMRLRNALDPKRFYRKEAAKKDLPKQIAVCPTLPNYSFMVTAYQILMRNSLGCLDWDNYTHQNSLWYSVRR